MPIVTNPTNEVITLPTGHVIAGDTYVSYATLARVENAGIVNMLIGKGRLAVKEVVSVETKEQDDPLENFEYYGEKKWIDPDSSEAMELDDEAHDAGV